MRRGLLLALGAILVGTSANAAPVEIQWWHAMSAVNGERVNKIAQDFNASQGEYKILPVYKGNYLETLAAGIAAFRAGNPPSILQVYDAGTATMMAAGRAIKPVNQLMQETNETFDPSAYLSGVVSYYSTADGKMLSMPFNSSSIIGFYSKDAFAKAGLDPDRKLTTWPEWIEAAEKVVAAGYSCGFTSSWITWTQIEQLSAWHNMPIATEANGLKGPKAVLNFDTPFMTKHVETLVKAQKTKAFDYSGRYAEGESKFLAGECGLLQATSSFYGNLKQNGKFRFGSLPLPYYPDIAGAPQNTFIGGASLWVMSGRSAKEEKGVARFFSFLSQTPLQVTFTKATGYLPITKAAYRALQDEGYYRDNPDLAVVMQQLTNKPPTENSRGVRLGNFVQIRDIWAEELEMAFSGRQPADTTLKNAVKRGNAVLRQFEASTK